MTLYLSIAADPSDSTAQTWRAQGYEIGIHPYANKPDTYPPYNITSLAQGFDVYSGSDGKVLMTLDLSDAATAGVEPLHRTDRDFAVSWIKPYGKGRKARWKPRR